MLGERLARATTLVAETKGYGMARTEIGPLVPHCLRLPTAGLRATVRFHASPMHAARHARLGHAAAVAAASSEVLDATRMENLEDEQRDDDND